MCVVEVLETYVNFVFFMDRAHIQLLNYLFLTG